MTYIVPSTFAIVTCSAAIPWLQGDSVPNRMSSHCKRSDLNDCAARFVTETHGLFQREIANSAVQEIVYIGATYSRLGDLH